MRELNFVETGRLEWRDAAEPALEDDRQALVRPLAVATCDLDTGVIAGRFPIPGPFAFGHECVAEVVEVGDAASVSDNIVDAWRTVGPQLAANPGAPVLVCGGAGSIACALRSTGPDGVCTSIGIYQTPTTPIPLLEMYSKNITFITGRVHAREAIPEALALVAEGRLDPEPVTGRHVAWDDAADALVEYREKLVIERGPSGA